MNLATIEVPKEEALRRFEAYRSLVKRGKRSRLREEDAALITAYKTLSEGKAIIDLHEAMRTAGIDALGRPKLAIVRADAQWVWFGRAWRSNGPVNYDARFGMDRSHAQTSAKERMRSVRIPGPVFGNVVLSSQDWRAMVPIIPPAIRPPASHLNQFHVLWEAAWQRNVPRDPALVRKVTGSLYALLAVWDLTPLEQAVLGMVRNAT